MGNKYASGLLQLVFIVTEDSAKLLMDNFYDNVMLIDSATGTMVELEVATLDIDSLVLLGDDESDDLKLA
ncbi:hypothetical protein ABE073_04175 [Lederbergia citrisecunda]|uniref:hypothetical protein n=1 Tax=Lederbergia citrisecunda TaxID=2833583 RepID=UPI003D26EBC5